MKCYYCGAELNFTDYCPECQADVHVWKIIACISNRFYNDGLEKAEVRDLSGAVESLKMSLHYNKMNREARNLLGLVYYEMGEPVNALSEWVISKSLNPEKNPASEYLAQVQKSTAKLDNITQSTKKLNQALTYCKDGSYDLAVIQLKKVLSVNPKSLKGYQLMALLYMRENRFDVAMRYLKQAKKLDSYNTDTMRYIAECQKHLHSNGKLKGAPKNEDSVTYQSGNDIIIRPAKITDNTAVMTVLNLLIGAAIGIAVAWFLVIPQIRHNANSNASKQVVEANETISSKEQTIEELQSEIDSLNSQLTTANDTITADEEKNQSYQQLLNAYASYAAADYTTAAEDIQNVNRDLLETDAQAIYDTILSDCQAALLGEKLYQAQVAYGQNDYNTCIPLFLEVVDANEGYSNGQAAYYLAFSYMYSGDYANAEKWFEVTAKYASGDTLASAQEMAQEMKNQLSGTTSTETADTTGTTDTTETN